MGLDCCLQIIFNFVMLWSVKTLCHTWIFWTWGRSRSWEFFLYWSWFPAAFNDVHQLVSGEWGHRSLRQQCFYSDVEVTFSPLHLIFLFYGCKMHNIFMFAWVISVWSSNTHLCICWEGSVFFIWIGSLRQCSIQYNLMVDMVKIKSQFYKAEIMNWARGSWTGHQGLSVCVFLLVSG